MTYTTNELITNAYYKAGIVARGFEVPDGAQVANGLLWLNQIIAKLVVKQDIIPYETTYALTAVIGQEEYVIPELIMIDTLTFTKDSVRYSMAFEPRNQYFGGMRTNNINSLPNEWYFEKGLGGGTLYIYFNPDQAYPMEIHGIFRLSEVTYVQDLLLTLDRFFIDFLELKLVERICAEFALAFPDGSRRLLDEITASISKNSRPVDLSIKKVSTLQATTGWGWGDINLGKGWRPPSWV